MSILLRNISQSVTRSSGSWLTLLLLGVVLVPSICLFWFINQAVQNERFAVRQKLVEAYRTHLVLAQERVQTHWQKLADDIEEQEKKLPAPALFAHVLRLETAEAAVCFDAGGQVLYPSNAVTVVPEKVEPAWAEARSLENQNPAAAVTSYARLAAQNTGTNLAARALHAQARCLLRLGDKDAAIAVMENLLAGKRYGQATDTQGRLLLPNVELMLSELLKDTAPSAASAVRARLQARLLDYDGTVMSTPQRLFLMRELQKAAPEMPAFPPLAAEDLAAQWLAADDGQVRETAVKASLLPGVWQFAPAKGRIVTLHRTEKMLARLQKVISRPDLPADVRVDLFPPDSEAEGTLLSLPMESFMPGWKLTLSLQDQQLFETTTRQRISSYVWVGALVVVTVIILGLLVWGLVRRQIALTQLRNDLVANVTHELKTPLASMRLLVETLLNAPQLHEPTAREYLQLIEKENLRLSRLIDNFLTFSRIERNKSVFTFRKTSATGIAESAAAAVRDRFQTPGCQFEIGIPAGLPHINADSDALVTALVNLLDNAWKYSGETKHIVLSAAAKNGDVIFSVRDNGIGLSPRDTKQIFHRFYQVNQHLSPTGGGCGLGLSIVQFIVAAHHGTVDVESTPGHGSTFRLVVPVAGASLSPEPSS